MKYDIVAIGNALVDVAIERDDSFLASHKMAKGGMELIDEDKALSLSRIFVPANLASGGSAANTAHGFASFGGKAAFIGKVKADEFGHKYIADMEDNGVDFINAPAETGVSTGCCFVVVTPDSQRTMSTFLGTANDIKEQDINEAVIKQGKILYAEGYLWDLPDAKAAILKAFKTAKANGVKVSFCLSDSFCVNRHRAEFLDLIEKYVDILFCNEHELLALYETENLDMAIDSLAKFNAVSAVTLNYKGSVVVYKGERISVAPHKVDNVIDSTGAGDLYASGFLYGLVNAESLEMCGKLGSYAAAQVIQQMGARVTNLQNTI